MGEASEVKMVVPGKLVVFYFVLKLRLVINLIVVGFF
jgi:hypothetical protein